MVPCLSQLFWSSTSWLDVAFETVGNEIPTGKPSGPFHTSQENGDGPEQHGPSWRAGAEGHTSKAELVAIGDIRAGGWGDSLACFPPRGEASVLPHLRQRAWQMAGSRQAAELLPQESLWSRPQRMKA